MRILRTIMMGTGTFAEPTFRALLTRPDLVQVVALFTQPDRVSGEVSGSTRQTGEGMATIAQAAGVPVEQPQSINTPDAIARLTQLQPDLYVVAAYGQILSREVLAVPALGGINVHASLLPKYRGAAPVAWAILRGETQTGVSIIRMSVGLDAGDVLLAESLDIGPDETAGELEARLAVLGARLTLQTVQALGRGPVVGIPQDQTQVTKAPKLTKQMGQIDWSQPAEALCRHIRAMQPWPTAYTHWHRLGTAPLRVIIAKARPTEPPADLLAAQSVPGTIALNQGQRLVVACGQHQAVEIHELQPAGKRRMSAAEFVRGRPPQPGDHFA